MPWACRHHRFYYYRSIRVGGRVRKQYFGSGPAAGLAADLVADRLASQATERDSLRADQELLAPLEGAMRSLDAACTLLIEATLTGAGYHRHDRGAWRRRRVSRSS